MVVIKRAKICARPLSGTLAHRIWPYLLRHLTVDRPNQVWCADVTYIPMRRGFLYLVAIMDWFSRKVLTWKLSNTMDADFYVTALEGANRTWFRKRRQRALLNLRRPHSSYWRQAKTTRDPPLHRTRTRCRPMRK